MAIDFFEPLGSEDDILDIRVGGTAAVDDEWVSVASAAEKARVSSGTVRHWYRSGLVPVRRSEGGQGCFLVRLGTVLDLAGQAETTSAAAELDALWRQAGDIEDSPGWHPFDIGISDSPLSRLDRDEAPDLAPVPPVPATPWPAAWGGDHDTIELDEPIDLDGPPGPEEPPGPAASPSPFRLGHNPDDVLPARGRRGRR